MPKTLTDEEMKTILESVEFLENSLNEYQKQTSKLKQTIFDNENSYTELENKYKELERKNKLLLVNNDKLIADIFVETETNKKRLKEKDIRIRDLQECMNLLEEKEFDNNKKLDNYELINTPEINY